jgi:hypothetical protein
MHMQVIFGLSSQERVLAEFRCYLLSEIEQGPRASRANRQTVKSVLKGYPQNSNSSIIGISSAITNGHLYLTQNCICFTTLFDGDRKTITDTTITFLRSEVKAESSSSVVQGVSTPCIVIRTKEGNSYSFGG